MRESAEIRAESAPATVPLRGGRGCVIRAAGEGDIEGLYALERAIVRARAGVVKHEDELPPDAAAYGARVRERIAAAAGGMAFALVAELEGRVVGEASVERIGLRMLRHVGVVALGVHPEAQGLGVGRALMARLVDRARAHRDADGGRVARLELYTRADNQKAVALYISLGFAIEGVRRGFLRRDDGALVDDLVMGLLLDAA